MSQYNFISVGGTGGKGTLLLDKSKGIGWVSSTTPKKLSVLKEDIASACWASLGKTSCMLKLTTKTGEVCRFDGLQSSEFDSVRDYISSIANVTLQRQEYDVRGGNWGTFKFDSDILAFNTVGSKTAFEVPISDIAQCALPGNSKTDVEIQLHETDTVAREDDCLVELRLFVPGGRAEDDEVEETAAQAFQQDVLNVANIRSSGGDVIVELGPDIGTFQTPRGRYAIEMCSSFLRLHGQTYDYKIMYSSISRLFLLPKQDAVGHVAFVIGLEEPIRQGQQRYHHLVMQMTRKAVALNVNLSEEAFREKYDGKLSPSMRGPMPDMVAKLFKLLTGKKVFVPGNFRSHVDEHHVKCSVKANDGNLFPLEKSFIFIHKPALCIPYEEVESVEFGRYAVATGGSTARTFDLLVKLRSGACGTDDKDVTFTSIDRNAYNSLFSFLSAKKMTIKNIQAAARSSNSSLLEDGEEEDAYARQLRREAAQAGHDDGDESEEDSDFGPDGESSDSSSGEDGLISDGEVEAIAGRKAQGGASGSASKRPKTKNGSAPKRGQQHKASPPVKKRKKADPSAPKAPRSAYIFYSANERAVLRQQRPELSFSEMARLVGANWMALGGDDKQVWNDKATADKVRYEEEMKGYVPPAALSGTEVHVAKRGKAKAKAKDARAPKRAKSAFLIFSMSVRPDVAQANPGMSFGEIGKVVGDRWRALSLEDRVEWNEKAAADKIRYDEEYAKYVPRSDEMNPDGKSGKVRQSATSVNAAGDSDSDSSSSGTAGSDSASSSESDN